VGRSRDMVDAAGLHGGGGGRRRRRRTGRSSVSGHTSLYFEEVKDLLGDRRTCVSETWGLHRCLTLGKVPVGYKSFSSNRCRSAHTMGITCDDATDCSTRFAFSVGYGALAVVHLVLI
jgi:hypothetical protein